MQPTSSLIGMATRYIPGRNAVQTVYWRSLNTSDANSTRMVKVYKTLSYDKTSKSNTTKKE